MESAQYRYYSLSALSFQDKANSNG